MSDVNPATLLAGSGHVVLDLFAGSGVGAAVKQLGADEKGVEQMPEAQETRRLNGLETVYSDVWDVEKAEGLEFDTLWASPPCQTFSVAGKGAGRKALDDVLKTIETGKYEDIAQLRAWATMLGDERIGLVLSPLHYIWRFRPEYVVLEQVPAVLPVWNAYVREMEAWGYSSWAGHLHSEQYGVPQTRKRAFLLAKRDPDWVASPPPATHSKYYTRDPQRMDPGVKPWVSMAEALDFGETDLVGFPRKGDWRGEVVSIGGQPFRRRDLRSGASPAQAVTEKVHSWSRFEDAA
ncbi:MAG: DNA cytosine methyltransferase [Microbacterium gubbeenense]|uniref:DNA cytosine methyltransferase n=1 Tax=Microbacterium gubbeenense TaxID=159896 RepID=UPI003F94C5E5